MKMIGTSASTGTLRFARWCNLGSRRNGGTRQLERRTAEPHEHPRDRAGEAEVHGHERPVTDGDPVGARHGLRRPHEPVHDPWLAADLGRHPTRNERHHREWTGENDRTIKPARLGRAPLPEANVKEDEP